MYAHRPDYSKFKQDNLKGFDDYSEIKKHGGGPIFGSLGTVNTISIKTPIFDLLETTPTFGWYVI